MVEIGLFSYDLVNKNNIVVGILPFGATIQRLLLPTKNGGQVDIVQGYDTLKGYEDDVVHYGCIAGRFCNRINNAKFTLDGKEYKVTENRPGMCLHGGYKGFNKYVWKVISSTEQSITMEHVSPDGDEGFPGELTVRVTYSLNDDNELHLKYTATTSKPTVLNLTNHAYFNLSGHNSGSILDNKLEVYADKYLPQAGENSCPSGEIADVAGTPFDFNKPFTIRDRIDMFPKTKGIDYSFLVRGYKKTEGCNECKPMLPAAKVTDPASGRWIAVSTNDVVCHIYTANYLQDHKGKEGAVHQKQSSFCIETHGCPDAPNFANFPSTTLRPGELYSHHTIWKFGGL